MTVLALMLSVESIKLFKQYDLIHFNSLHAHNKFLAPTRSSRKANVRPFVRLFVRPFGSNLSRALILSGSLQGLFRVSSSS